MNIKNIGQKIVLFPLTKIIVGLVVIGGIIEVVQMQLSTWLNFTSIDADFKSLIIGIIVAALAISCYVLLYKFYERRKITEFSTNGIVRSLITGIVLGAVLQSLTILVIYINHGYSIVSVNPILFLIPPLTMAFTSGVVEETLTRGIIFRITEEKLGSYVALIISALLFGAAHLPSATLVWPRRAQRAEASPATPLNGHGPV